MKKVVIDTDIVIDHLRQPDQPTLFSKLAEDKNIKLLLPAISFTELYIGKSVEKKIEERRLLKAISPTELILADKKISKEVGVLIRKYSYLYLADALVVATAIIKKAFLCTFNVKHFAQIVNLRFFDYKRYA